MLHGNLKNHQKERFSLKAVDTIGNCQRLAFTVGVSQHMHKITSFSKAMTLQREPFLTMFYTQVRFYANNYFE